MFRFNLFLYALPTEPLATVTQIVLANKTLDALVTQQVDKNLMATTFEQAAQSLMLLPRMFFEMDGSFVWRGEQIKPDSTEPTNWQVDGMIYDIGGPIARVELKGDCPVDSFERLIDCFQPAQQLLAYSQEHGHFIRVADIIQALRT